MHTFYLSLYMIYAFCVIVHQLPQASPGLKNYPFRITKHSNAYMLLYIRESEKDKLISAVNDKDIAEHLRVRCLINLFGVLVTILKNYIEPFSSR